MLRIAATLLGFAVVAFSIGFNTIHYPLVWEMTGPAPSNEASQPVAVSPPARSEDPAPAPPLHVLPAISRAEVKPIPDVASRTAVDRSSPADTNAPPDAKPAADAGAAATGADTQRPLVPITPASAPAVSRGGAELAPGVRRLPPVEPANSALTIRGAGASNGPIPIYPSTGM